MDKDIDNKVEYFIHQTNERLIRIESKLEQLISWRALLMGGAVAISALVSLSVTIFFGH